MSGRQKAYWVLVTVTAAVYLLMVVWSGPRLSYAAGGLMPFDVRLFGYTQASAQAFLDALGPDGRAFYLGVQLRIDALFPALFALVTGFALWWLYVEKSGPMRLAILVLPALGAVFDYLENARIAAMLRAVNPSPDLVAAASQATVLKFLFVGAAIALVLVGVAGNWKAQ